MEGKLILRHMYSGTKSEGTIAYLLAEDGREYRLFRPDIYPVNDDYFFPFDEKAVSIEGVIEDEGYIAVLSIEEVRTDNDLL